MGWSPGLGAGRLPKALAVETRKDPPWWAEARGGGKELVGFYWLDMARSIPFLMCIYREVARPFDRSSTHPMDLPIDLTNPLTYRLAYWFVDLSPDLSLRSCSLFFLQIFLANHILGLAQSFINQQKKTPRRRPLSDGIQIASMRGRWWFDPRE